MLDIEKAFAGLNVEPDIFEKAKKGEKKKGNPRYRKTMKDGKTIYVLVNKDEHPNQDKRINEDNFNRLQQNGRVERHYDEAPIIRDVNQLRHIDWIPQEKVELIKRCLKRAEFFNKSIAFAKATGNSVIANAHTQNQNNEYSIIDNIVKKAFEGKNFEGMTMVDIDELNRMEGVTISGANEDSLDYLNNVYTGFDLKKLLGGMKTAIQEQKDRLEKIGIDPEDFKPSIYVQLQSSGFSISMDHPNKVVTDNSGFKCDLGVNMKRAFSGTSNKSVYHAVFTLGKTNTTSDNEQNPLRGGFAKGVMTNFWEQYQNTNMSQISVTAANESYGGGPYNGANTWGKWGFTCSKSIAENMINSAKSRFSSPKKKLVDEVVLVHKDQNDVCKFKKEENGAVSKITFENGSVTNKHGRTIETKIITKPTSDGKFRSKVLTSKVITPKDIEKMKEIYDKYFEANPEAESFRVKEWYDKMDNGVLRGILGGNDYWKGYVDLNNESQRKDFEENVNKVYNSPTKEEIAAFEKKSNKEQK